MLDFWVEEVAIKLLLLVIDSLIIDCELLLDLLVLSESLFRFLLLNLLLIFLSLPQSLVVPIDVFFQANFL